MELHQVNMFDIYICRLLLLSPTSFRSSHAILTRKKNSDKELTVILKEYFACGTLIYLH
jgi:hypothetical protein